MSITTLTEKDLEHPPVDIKLLSEKEKQELITADTISITSGTTLGADDLAFNPVKSLFINTRGIPVLRLPLPSSELEISIYNNDGSLAYKSIRERRSPGNCTLTDAEGKSSIATEYFFGPGKDPILHILSTSEGTDIDLKTQSKWTSRSHTMTLPDGRKFTWEYKKERGFGGENKKGTAIVMNLENKRIAALIRNNETRTPGSKSCSAGNGGELVLSEQIGSKDGVSEELVVASCMLMLKKEIDRRRTVQFMTIAAAVSSGG